MWDSMGLYQGSSWAGPLCFQHFLADGLSRIKKRRDIQFESTVCSEPNQYVAHVANTILSLQSFNKHQKNTHGTFPNTMSLKKIGVEEPIIDRLGRRQTAPPSGGSCPACRWCPCSCRGCSRGSAGWRRSAATACSTGTSCCPAPCGRPPPRRCRTGGPSPGTRPVLTGNSNHNILAQPLNTVCLQIGIC